MVAYKGSSYQGGLPRFEHALLACDIGLYIQVLPTVLHSVVAHESMQFTPLFSTSSSNTTHDRSVAKLETQSGSTGRD